VAIEVVVAAVLVVAMVVVVGESAPPHPVATTATVTRAPSVHPRMIFESPYFVPSAFTVAEPDTSSMTAGVP
jgi:hypothetical protein